MTFIVSTSYPGGGGGVLLYMDYIGGCRCEKYGFQASEFTVGQGQEPMSRSMQLHYIPVTAFS